MQEGKTRWHLSGQSKEQCKHNHRQPLQEWQDEKQESKKQSNLPHLPLFTAACFREETIVAVSTLFAKAAKCLFELNMHRSENKCRPRRSQLKTVGTQKVSPPPFCSTLQLSRSFKLLSWPYNGGFSGTIFVWEKVLPQSHRAGTSATPALNRQGGNIRVAAFKLPFKNNFCLKITFQTEAIMLF